MVKIQDFYGQNLRKKKFRGPQKWTSKINYTCMCDEKNAKKKFLKPWIHTSIWA